MAVVSGAKASASLVMAIPFLSIGRNLAQRLKNGYTRFAPQSLKTCMLGRKKSA